MNKKIINPLSAFTFADNNGDCTEADDLDTDLHDNHLLPYGCKRYDEWMECDIYELLGKEE